MVSDGASGAGNMAGPAPERRLTAILAADIVAYSTLISRDELGTLERLRRLTSDAIRPLIARHRGRLVKQMGDGFLVEFGSAVNAFLCAHEWQARLGAENRPAGDGFRFRIGLHLGDVVVEGDDILGDGVNVAARLEQVAPEGGIALSGALHEQVVGKVDAAFVGLGPTTLKNIARPVDVWTVDDDGAAELSSDRASGNPGPGDAASASMAVLPFANLTRDREQDYLALGIADQLTTTLGHVPWFFVSAQAAAFAPGLASLTIIETGRRLGVRYLIDGTVQKAGPQLRIAVRLSETQQGRQLWSKAFTGREDGFFDLQDRIAETVIGEIEPRMRQLEIDRSQAKHGNLTAFDCYLRALPLVRAMTEPDLDAALRWLQTAIEHNPDYPVAHGLIAWLMTLRLPQGQPVDIDTGLDHARRALRKGAFDSEALSLGGYSEGFFLRDPDLGLVHLWEALALNPNSARTRDFAGWLLLYAGRAAEALDHFDHSLQLSPIEDFAFRALTGRAFAKLFLGETDAAIQSARRALAANPNFTVCHRVLAPALVEAGRLDEAQAVVADLRSHHPGLTVERFGAETRFQDAACRNRLLDGLGRAGLPWA